MSSEVVAVTPAPDYVSDGWLLKQLRAWPSRVDPDRTTNIEALMDFAAVEIDRLTRQQAEARATSGAGEVEAFRRGAEAMQRALADALRDHLNSRSAAIANSTPLPEYRP